MSRGAGRERPRSIGIFVLEEEEGEEMPRRGLRVRGRSGVGGGVSRELCGRDGKREGGGCVGFSLPLFIHFRVYYK